VNYTIVELFTCWYSKVCKPFPMHVMENGTNSEGLHLNHFLGNTNQVWITQLWFIYLMILAIYVLCKVQLQIIDSSV